MRRPWFVILIDARQKICRGDMLELGMWCRLAILVLLPGLAGCLPVPYARSPDFIGSRRALSDGPPAFIAPGKTTRADVLQVLGMPEIEAPDESWFYYKSDYRKLQSGIALLIGGPGGPGLADITGAREIILRRLQVHFSAGGVVTDIDFSQQTCAGDHYYPNDYRTTWAQDIKAGCTILARDTQLAEERVAAGVALAARGHPVVARYDNAQWISGSGKPRAFESVQDMKLVCSSDSATATVAITENALLLLDFGTRNPRRSARSVEIPLTEITAVVRLDMWWNADWGVDIKTVSGKIYSFTLCAPRPKDGEKRTAAARNMLEKSIGSTSRK